MPSPEAVHVRLGPHKPCTLGTCHLSGLGLSSEAAGGPACILPLGVYPFLLTPFQDSLVTTAAVRQHTRCTSCHLTQPSDKEGDWKRKPGLMSQSEGAGQQEEGPALLAGSEGSVPGEEWGQGWGPRERISVLQLLDELLRGDEGPVGGQEGLTVQHQI